MSGYLAEDEDGGGVEYGRDERREDEASCGSRL